MPEVIREVEVAAVVEEETVEYFDMNSSDMELEPDRIISSNKDETTRMKKKQKHFDVKGISMFDEIEKARGCRAVEGHYQRNL